MAVVPPLLAALHTLEAVARRVHPPDLSDLIAAIGEGGDSLRAVRPKLAEMPPELVDLRRMLETASDETLAAFDEFRGASEMGAAYRALRHTPRALEALYPLASFLPPVNRFFLAPGARHDGDLAARFLRSDPPRHDVGIQHVGEPGERGGVSLYVPETYDPEAAHPVIFALHGGAGSGRSFLWSWLRDARTHGAILVSPTAVGDTWALDGPDHDTPNLLRMLHAISSTWNVDWGRVLLTGMSDGGTFSYVSGLEPSSPFTHLAPVSAAFHPLLAAAADGARMSGLPIFITHGAQDWMFDIEMAREARDSLAAAGADVTYRELEDLSHTYPREINAEIIAWLNAPG